MSRYLILCIGVLIVLFKNIASQSNFDPNVWINATKCVLESGTEGRCILNELCPTGRESLIGPSCGSGQLPDVCCESKPEDFVDKDYGRVAKQECNRYMKSIDWKYHGYVLGGMDARPQEFTFMAALGYGANVSDIKFHCGGSLISETHILTAAHCLFSKEDGPVRYVLLGDLDIYNTTDDASPQYLYVQNVTVHPEYRPSSVYHDIAILHLNRPAMFTPYVQPACLDFGQLKVEENQTNFYATGWGYIDTEGNRASHLQEVGLIEVNFDKCAKAFPANRRKLAMGLVNTQMCAAGRHERKDTCNGDSGGPLSRTNDDIRYSRYKGYIVAGITSFGKLCGYTNAPGVYTRVEKYVSWIESVVWPEKVAEMADLNKNNPVNVQTSANSPPAGNSHNPVTNNEPLNNKQSDNAAAVGPQGIMGSPQVQVQSVLPHTGGTNTQVTIQVAVTVNIPQTTPTSNRQQYATWKPVNLIDIHYFSDKK